MIEYQVTLLAARAVAVEARSATPDAPVVPAAARARGRPRRAATRVLLAVAVGAQALAGRLAPTDEGDTTSISIPAGAR